MDFLSSILNPFKEEKDLLSSLGDPNQAFSKVMDARGENPGASVDPRLAGLSPDKLAILDRVGSARQARESQGLPLAFLGGALGIAPYEGLKWIGQNVPGGKNLFQAAGRLTGDAKADDNYDLDETTSPASLKNIAAYFSGLF